MFVKTAFNICTVNIFIAGNSNPIVALALPPGGADPLWVEVSGLVNLAAGTSSLGLIPTVACDTFDEIWFDDITLTPVPESA